MHVHRVGLSQADQLLQSLVDEDDADEGSEGFFGEAGDVAHQAAGIRGHQHHAEEGGPQPYARPQGEVGECIVPGKTNKEWEAQQEAPRRAVLRGKSGAVSERVEPVDGGFHVLLQTASGLQCRVWAHERRGPLDNYHYLAIMLC